ncbi:MAG: hypothetical protein ACK42D_01155 [Candidatus Paceibacteria bacterium]
MNSKLHKNIMRRVWYAYGIWQVRKQLTAKAFWQGVVFGSSFVVFTQVVHVTSVFRNILETPLGLVPEYMLSTILSAIRNGDLAKVVTLLLLVSISISIAKKVTLSPQAGRKTQIV